MRKFLEKLWWQGVGGIVGIIALALVVLQFLGKVNVSWLAISVAFNVILTIALLVVAIWAIRLKRKYEDVSGRMKKAAEIIKQRSRATERKRVLLPDESQIWKLNIDSTLLTELHGQAHSRAIAGFHDAKLNSLSMIVNPYDERDRVSILFGFYSRWADRKCTYILSETNDMRESLPSEPATTEENRVTFDELPWLKDPDWSQFVMKSCEKVGPLSPTSQTEYHVSAYAGYEPRWTISFKDGVTGKESTFCWDGKGEPIPYDLNE